MLGSAKDLFVYSRAAIERIAPHEAPHGVISITSSPDDTARIPGSAACLGVLRLSFADADEPSDLVLFDETHAAAIRGFLEAHANVSTILVHCDAGVSRSPAVAAAIARATGEDDAPWFRRYRPNARVYRILRAALG